MHDLDELHHKSEGFIAKQFSNLVLAMCIRYRENWYVERTDMIVTECKCFLHHGLLPVDCIGHQHSHVTAN